MSEMEECEIIECARINLTTCKLLPPPVNSSNMYLSSDELDNLYDDDGCFYTEMLRKTYRYETYMKFSLCMGILTIVSGSFGLVGNIVNIIVLCSKEMRSKCFNNLLTLLNVTDSVHIVFAILEELRYDFPDVYDQIVYDRHSFYPYVHYPGYRISIIASIYMIISVGIERYLAVCRPHHFRQVQTQNYRALVYMIPAIFAAVVVSMPRFVEIGIREACFDLTNCSCGIDTEKYNFPTPLRMNKLYIIFYHLWFWIIVTGIIPFIILAVINVKIFFAMRTLKQRLNGRRRSLAIRQSDGQVINKEFENAEKRKRSRTTSSNNAAKECNMAIILICTTFTFFLLHLPRLLTSVYEALNIHNQLKCEGKEKRKDFLPLWFLFSISAMNTLLVLNASSNFLIYLFAGVSFRSKFHEIFKVSCFGVCGSNKEKETKQVSANVDCAQLLKRRSSSQIDEKQDDKEILNQLSNISDKKEQNESSKSPL